MPMTILIPWSIIGFELLQYCISTVYLRRANGKVRSCSNTFFKYGSISLADQPTAFHASKSALWARVYTTTEHKYQSV